MPEENCCKNCRYYRYDPEDYFDHYRIPEHHLCTFQPVRPYTYKEIDPIKGTCENFLSQNKKGGN